MSNNAQTRRRKAPPVPKFEQTSSINDSSNKQKLEGKLNDFLTTIKATQVVSTEEIKQVQLNDQKQIKKNTLANINSKLNNMLNSKKINLNKIEDPKNNNLSLNQSKSIELEDKNRRDIQIQYQPFTPNSYMMSKHYYIERFQNFIQKQQSIQISKKEENQMPQQKQMIQEEQHLQQKQQLALRMMQRLGYKVGEGLGKHGQGIKTPLTVKKTTDSSCIIQPSAISLNQLIKPQVSARNVLEAFNIKLSKIVVLVDIIKLSELNDDIQNQIKKQLSNYGKIMNWIIYMMGLQIRVFVEYQNQQQAFQAFVKLNNMYFNQNLVSIRFYKQDSFKKYQLNLDLHQHVSF